MFSWWWLVGVILVSVFFYFLAEARQEQRQQNNQREDNSQDDSCLVSEEPKHADENSANVLQGNRSPFEESSFPSTNISSSPLSSLQNSLSPTKKTHPKQKPKTPNCQNVLKEAEIFCSFQRNPSAPRPGRLVAA